MGYDSTVRVLIVEDEPKSAAYLRKGLCEHGYVADLAGNGEDGLYLARNSEYDLLILDVMLPQRDGWSVISELRRAGSETPVLFLTARDSVPDRVKGLDLGADDYLIKPFDLAELLARVRALIRRAAGVATNAVEIDDVSIDLRSRTVTWAGTAIPLTATEYRILEYLALHRGRVVSRTELYEHLRGENDDTLSNVMDVHVAGIRRKLGPDLISTKRGHGYCIED